jgi:DNA (cytosine-5)-methyltransferase 1
MARVRKQKKEPIVTFIDLFAGIGEFHIALSNLGAKCVMACEIDEAARTIYKVNHNPEMMHEDITTLELDAIPDHDLLCAGFPCQPFSQGGFKRGFHDTRGTLFFNIHQILKHKKPKAFFLENVRHIKNHDGGNTMKIIESCITELGYSFHSFIVRASDHGLPQHRPRCFMVGFANGQEFSPPKRRELEKTMSDILGGECPRDIGFTLRVGGRHSPITGRHNWDGYIVDGEARRLSIKEAAAMQGFPEDFVFPNSQKEAMKQLGNSVAIPAIQDYAKEILASL